MQPVSSSQLHKNAYGSLFFRLTLEHGGSLFLTLQHGGALLALFGNFRFFHLALAHGDVELIHITLSPSAKLVRFLSWPRPYSSTLSTCLIHLSPLS